MKVCRTCKISKEEILFSKRLDIKGGLQYKCKTCVRNYDKAYYLLNHKDKLESSRKYRLENPEGIKASRDKRASINVVRSRLYRIKNREKVLATNKAYRQTHKLIRKRYKQNNKDKTAAYSAKRKATKINQTPRWVNEAELKRIALLYKEANRLTKTTGTMHHVDHIVPLNSTKVSGFHCLCNLQIIEAYDNLVKGNRTWPNMQK
jgi:hypothetical protein